MSKDHMPGSMDLLLDTMCNTFGGIMFIALSLSLAFFVCRFQRTEVEDIEKIKQELQQQKEEQHRLDSQKKDLSRKLNTLKSLPLQDSQTQTDLPQRVTQLQQECKDIERENELAKLIVSNLQTQIENLKIENQKVDSENQKKKIELAENNAKLKKEYQRYSIILDQLNKQLQNIPVKKLQFAHNERTTQKPYVLVLKNNCLYRLGVNYEQSSKEIRVKRVKDMLHLTLLHGTLLTSISSDNLLTILSDYHTSNDFLWILVHPDSYESFVHFRRLLREEKIQVFWYITVNSILYLSSNATHSSSY